MSGKPPEIRSGPSNQIVGMLSKATGFSLLITCKWPLPKPGASVDCEEVGEPGPYSEV